MVRSLLVIGTGLVGTSVGLAAQRAGVTVFLSDCDPRAARLAEALDLSQPTASRTLQSLEAEGLVTRQQSRSDGRVSHYVATAKGRRALAKVHAFHVSQLAEALDEVAPARRADLAGAVTEELPGVVGAVPEVDGFASAWSALHGVTAATRFDQRIYAMEELVPPGDVEGVARLAGADDRASGLEDDHVAPLQGARRDHAADRDPRSPHRSGSRPRIRRAATIDGAG